MRNLILIKMYLFLLTGFCATISHQKSSTNRIVVIGGGVGGLVTSSRLALSGHKVTLLEANDRVGGRMNSEHLKPSLDQYRFDVGPSLLLLPDVYNNTFRLLGEKIEDHIDILPVRPFYRCFFEEDNTTEDIYAEYEKNIETIIRLESDGKSHFLSYMKNAKAFLEFGLPAVIEERPIWKGFKDFCLACLQMIPLFPHQVVLQSLFKSEKIRAMLSFQDLYIGLSPYETPAVFSLLQALELDRGIFYPRGGFGQVATALELIAKKAQVQIRTNCRVKYIHTSASGAVSGVELVDGEVLPADVVVSNVDVLEGEKLLPVGMSLRDKRVADFRPSCGVVSISWALSKRIASLPQHSIFLSKHYEQSWKAVEQPDTSSFQPDAFNFYVHAPSRTDPSVCPAGHDAITVLVPVPPLSQSDEVVGLDISSVRTAVIRRLQAAGCVPNDFESRIVGEGIRTPSDWKAEFSLYRGSAFGLAHSLSQLSFLRPQIRHPHIRGLYRVGASTRPGNGVPLVMIGARLTSDRVLQDIGTVESS